MEIKINELCIEGKNYGEIVLNEEDCKKIENAVNEILNEIAKKREEKEINTEITEKIDD